MLDLSHVSDEYLFNADIPLDDDNEEDSITEEDKELMYAFLNTPHFYRDTEIDPPPTQEQMDRLSKWYDDEKSPIENYKRAFAAALTLPEVRVLVEKSGLPVEPDSLIQMLFGHQSQQALTVREKGIDLLVRQQ